MLFQDLSDIADVRIGDVDSLAVVVQGVKRHHHLACRVQGLGFGVYGLGFRVLTVVVQ